MSQHEILVIDDDLDIREGLQALLEDAGYRVVPAANGREGLDRLRAGAQPCAILLDLMMPVLDGWRFCAELARDPAHARVPVIVISAAPRDLATRPHPTLAVASLSKPFDIHRLLEMVARYC